MAGYYQGLLKAQGEIADVERKRGLIGLLGTQQRASEKELTEFESTAPLRIGMKEAELKAKQALAPMQAAQTEGQGIENRANTLKLIQTGKLLFPQVGDQQSLDQANAQFEQLTGQPSPYRGKPWTPQFRDRVINDLMTIEQRMEAKKTEAGKWQYDSARGGLVNMQTGEFKPATQGGTPIGSLKDPDAAKRADETDRTLGAYIAAREGLMSGLGQSATGPIAGRIPAMATHQQIAQGGVSAMAPVLKQLFRVAGEGVFTDRDQALLLDMVPDRTDSPEARRVKMANIDRIVSAKLGRALPGPGGGEQAYGRRDGDRLKLNPQTGRLEYRP